MLNQILYNKIEIPKIPIIATSSSFPSIGSESRSQCGHWKPPCMARESIRADNEFWNRKPTKIRRPAKLSRQVSRADNCSFIPGHNIQTEKSFISDRQHIFRLFVRSRQRKQHVASHTIFVPGKKKYPEYIPHVSREANPLIHDVTFSFRCIRIYIQPTCQKRNILRTIFIQTCRKNAASRYYFFLFLFALGVVYLAHDHPLIITIDKTSEKLKNESILTEQSSYAPLFHRPSYSRFHWYSLVFTLRIGRAWMRVQKGKRRGEGGTWIIPNR